MEDENKNQNFSNLEDLYPTKEGGQRVDNDSLVHGQEGGLRGSVHGQTPLVHGQRVDNDSLVHGLSMDKEEIVHGQRGYLSMDKAAEYSSLSEKTLRRKIREVLISKGLDWKSSPEEIAQRLRKIKKVNVKKTILGFSSFDWELSVIWLDELMEKVARRQRVDNDSLVHGQEGGLSMDSAQPSAEAQFMVDSPPPASPVESYEFIEIDGRKYTKEHLQDILENYKEEKETKKTMMELQKQINVVMAQMGQIQKMMLLKSPKEEQEN